MGGIPAVWVSDRTRNNPAVAAEVRGNDHVLERNKIFNVGIEKGDGGAVYSGAQMWSYSNVYRHNFLRHLMCVPQAHPRGGIYPDDLDGDILFKLEVSGANPERRSKLARSAAEVIWKFWSLK